MRARARRLVMAMGAAVALAAATPIADARADDASSDEKAELRRLFGAGLERYGEGDYRGALAIWEPIVARLGVKEGYRLVFNLARAHDKLGERARAATEYATYIEQVVGRRDQQEPLEEGVLRQERDARLRLGELEAQLVKVHVPKQEDLRVRLAGAEARDTPFVAYLEPGTYPTQATAPGNAGPLEPSELKGRAGETVELVFRPKVALVVPPPPRKPPAPEPPFGAGWLIVSGAVTGASVLFPAFTYAHALDVRDEFFAASESAQPKLREDYTGARTTAYVALGVTLTLAAVTTGLVVYWFAGRKAPAAVSAASAAGLRF